MKLQELISKMSLKEKIGQLSQFGTSIYKDEVAYYEDHYDEGQIGSYLTVSGAKIVNTLQKECKDKFPTYIPLLFAEDVIHGYKTTMPIPLAQSCSWNPEAAKKGAKVAAKEAAAAGIRWTFSPMVDIARDPRWGRIAEGYGEDTYLCSQFAKATVEGYQEEHVMACMKHFIGYGACMGGRDYGEAEMSYQTLYDTYLPPFQAGIDAGAASVMTAFHSLNGVPCTGSEFLLKDVLREKCGFEGIIISDAGAVNELVLHGYAEDWKDAAYKGFKASVNVLMSGDLYNDYLPELIEEGKITEEEIDEALLPVLEWKLRMGLFENPYVDEALEQELFFCKEHIDISREMGRECIVLLENDGILPFAKHKVALVGPYVDDKDHVLGTWACKKDPNHTVSIREGLLHAGVDLGTVEDSDLILVVLGENSDQSGEAKSKTDLHLERSQQELLEEMIQTGKPVVLLISAGRPLIVEPYRDKVSALAYIWQLGTGTGDAVADVLTGAVDVSGRLSVSVPRSVGQLPMYYNHPSTGRPYKGESWIETRYIDESPLPSYPFGYGLSYTEFQYSDLILSAEKMSPEGEITVSCRVSNVGERPGQTVAQLYIRDLVGSVVRPIKELKQFQKISLASGESKEVSFVLSAEELAFHNERLERKVEAGEFHVWIGEHSDDKGRKKSFWVG